MPRPQIILPVLAGIGNAIMAVPLVRAIKRRLPDAHVVILARNQPMAEVFRRVAEADEVIVTGGGAKNLWRQIRLTRSRRAAAYVIPFPSNRWQYAMLAQTSGAKRKILHGYPVGRWRALGIIPFTRTPAVRGLHDVDQNLRLIDLLPPTPADTAQAADTADTAATTDTAADHMPAPARPVARPASIAPPRPAGGQPLPQASQPLPANAPAFALTPADHAAAGAMRATAGLDAAQRYVVVHAGSAQTILAQAKRWPPQKYAGLIEAIHTGTGLAVLLVEGPDEAGVAAQITRNAAGYAPAVVPLRGGLGDAGALLAGAALYVGSDSGLAHLAAAVGTRCVTLFAPADPDRVSPYGQRDLVVQPIKACPPCFLYPWEATRPKMRCTEPFCIREITVEQVMAAVRQGLGDEHRAVPDRGQAAVPA